MPKYDYVCKDCEVTFEIEKKITEPHPEKCEQCGGTVSRVFAPVGVTFKGTGFYKTDNRGK